jgi:hypothetical protein
MAPDANFALRGLSSIGKVGDEILFVWLGAYYRIRKAGAG